MKLLEVLDVSRKDPDYTVLDHISFSQLQSEKIAIAGESGSGKSTLLKVIGGLVQPDSGKVVFRDVRVEGPLEKLVPGHSKIAYLSQHFELRNHYRVEEILEYSNKLPFQKASALYEICDISHLLKRYTNEASGGERQRIALAAVLSSSPELLLLDEPFSNLDPIHKNILQSVIRRLQEELNITCMLSSHEPGETLSWADTIIVLKNGKLVQKGSPKDVYQCPANEYVAGLFGRFNRISKSMLSAFALPGSGSKAFLRPEELSINKESGSLIGEVMQANYLGSHYETEVSLTDITVTVRSPEGFQKGDKVFISLKTAVIS